MSEQSELRDIPGYEGRYAVTSDGRVYSHPKPKGRSYRGLWIKPKLNKKGYLQIGLLKEGVRKFLGVHKMVALAWLPAAAGTMTQVNHKNGIKTDNRDSNLEWCTPKQNIAHAIASGLTNTRTPAKLAAFRRNVLKAHAATREKHRLARSGEPQ